MENPLPQRIENFFIQRYKDWSGGEQFKGSGARLSRMVEEMCWPSSKIQTELEKCFKAVYPDKYSEMLVSRSTSVWTLCPHHLVPCNFIVFIGYVPKDRILGLSKFSRISLVLSKRPVMQEQYSREVADAVMDNLQPIGVGVHVIGRHGCIECRGVTQDSVSVTTTVLKGNFLTDSSVKEEFLWNCQKQ